MLAFEKIDRRFILKMMRAMKYELSRFLVKVNPSVHFITEILSASDSSNTSYEF